MELRIREVDKGGGSMGEGNEEIGPFGKLRDRGIPLLRSVSLSNWPLFSCACVGRKPVD